MNIYSMAKKDVQLTHLIGYTLSKLRTYEWVKLICLQKRTFTSVHLDYIFDFIVQNKCITSWLNV